MTFCRLATTLALAAALLATLPACSSGPPGRGVGGLFQGDWEDAGVSPHPALNSETVLRTWRRGSGAEREVRRSLLTRDADVAPASLTELLQHCLPPDTPYAAQRFAELAHLLGVDGVPAAGAPLIAGDDPGGSGTYGPTDAARWDVEYDPTPVPFGGGHRVRLLLHVPPVKHELLPHSSPHKVVMVRELVYPDGSLRLVDAKTLTNGTDAERYARW